MPAPHHCFFTGRMPFLPPNQQRQSTEGIHCKMSQKSLLNNNNNHVFTALQTKHVGADINVAKSAKY